MAFIKTKFSSLLHLLDEQIGDFVLVSWFLGERFLMQFKMPGGRLGYQRAQKLFPLSFPRKKIENTTGHSCASEQDTWISIH